jgi:hypothetical protein
MANIDTVYRMVLNISNKTQSGGIVGPARFNDLAQAAQMDEFNALVKQYEETQVLTDAMNPFLTMTTLLLDPLGRATLPADYEHHVLSSSYYAPDGVMHDVDMLKTAQAPAALASEVRPPTDYFRKGRFLPSRRVQYVPATPNTIELTYFKRPADPAWGYTLVNNRPVYSPSASTQFTIPDFKYMELVARICSYIGINIREPDLQQFAQMMKQEQAIQV